MKIALAQIDVKAGDPEANFSRIEEMVCDAKEENVDIICFGEMCVGGYLVGDLWLDDEWCRYLMSFNDKIKNLSEVHQIGIIYGNVCLLDKIEPIKSNDGRETMFCNTDGRAIRFNAAYAYYKGSLVKRTVGSKYLPDGIQPKVLLPNYRYFDDRRYFMSAWEFNEYEDGFLGVSAPFLFPIGEGKKVGVELCEDMWCKDYNINPSFALSSQGSEIIINISASPWTCGKNSARDRKVLELLNWEDRKYKWLVKDYEGGTEEVKESERFYSQHEHDQMKVRTDSDGKCHFKEDEWVPYPEYPPFAYVNCVGSQNNGKNILVFDGASTVYGSDGLPKILGNSDYKEELIVFNTESIPEETVVRRDEVSIPRKYQAIIRGIQHMSETTGIKKYVHALSGGVDSSLVLCLLSEAVGVDNMIVINMPSRYNSQKTKDAAQMLCNRLGVKDYRVIPIDQIVDVKKQYIFGKKEVKSLTEENVQAETRAMILSALAGEEKSLFTCNGNKNEMGMGYFTLNADGRGAICPIGDLTKREVYDMAQYINREVFKTKVIPENMLPDNDYQFVGVEKIAPSAELKNNQIDPIKVSYHCALIEQFMDYKKIGVDQIMLWWIEGVLHEKLGISKKMMSIYGVDKGEIFIEDLKWLLRKIRGSVFKRIQSPPIITTSKTSFGFDLRESILRVSIDSLFTEDLLLKVFSKKEY